jgi:hypothetical protein
VDGSEFRTCNGGLIKCHELRKREEGSRPVLSKVSVVVGAGNRSKDSALYRYNRESTMDKMSAPKKKFKGFPMFLHLKILKRPFLGDMRQWWSRH